MDHTKIKLDGDWNSVEMHKKLKLGRVIKMNDETLLCAAYDINPYRRRRDSFCIINDIHGIFMFRINRRRPKWI